MTMLAQADFAAALLDPAAPVPAGITTARGLPDAKRFAVYRNNVVVGLTKALAARFPVVERLVGEDFFRMMARAFVGRSRPASPLMFEYGDGFPDFIEAFAPAASVPYLADVARLEAAWSRAYNAADAEPLGLAAFAAVAPDVLPECRLAPHPATALVRSAHPVGSIWQAHQAEKVAPVTEWRAQAVLLARPRLHVVAHIVPEADQVFAARALAGDPLGVAAEAATGASAGFRFGPALAGLTASGAFLSIIEPGQGRPS